MSFDSLLGSKFRTKNKPLYNDWDLNYDNKQDLNYDNYWDLNYDNNWDLSYGLSLSQK